MRQLVRILILGFAILFAFNPCFADSSLEEAKESARVEDLLRRSLSVWKGGEIIMTKFDLPADHASKMHSHPGEGFLFVAKGSLTMVYEDGSEVAAGKGEVVAIPMGKVHRAQPGGDGVEGVVFRVHPEGAPERTLAE